MEYSPMPLDYYGQTTLHPMGLIAVVVLGLAMLTVPRKYAVWPMIFMACFIAPAQRVVVLSLNFNLLRVMVLFATARILSRREYAGIRMSLLDWTIVAYCVSGIIIYPLQQGEPQAIISQMGSSYDAIGMYFTFRCLIQSWDDLAGVVLGFIVASVPVTVAFLFEHATGRNIFGSLGGVPEITMVRDGRIRCQGAFAHPILAGCFWVAILPLICARWFDYRQNKQITMIGILCSLTITGMCASSTPVMALFFALFAACLFPLRRYMKPIRWAFLFLLIGLHLVMKAPVWHLISRISIVGGSTGDHRFRLINAAVERFDEWWLLGIVSTAHWGIGLVDVTNQYILEGVHAGLATLILFVCLLSLGFRNVGRMRRAAALMRNRTLEIHAWAVGIMIFVHVTNFIGVSYFGQITMLTWMSLAISSSLSQKEVLGVGFPPRPMPLRSKQ